MSADQSPTTERVTSDQLSFLFFEATEPLWNPQAFGLVFGIWWLLGGLEIAQ